MTATTDRHEQPTPLFTAWLLGRQHTGHELNREQFAQLVNRFDGTHGDLRTIIRALDDKPLLQLWHAAHRNSNTPALKEMAYFAWHELNQRAHDDLANHA